MKFTIIDDRDLNLKKRGYCWAENSQRFFDYDYWRYHQIVLDEALDIVTDSFADGTYPVCKGEDGKLYTVMFRVSEHEDGSYWYRPVIWEQIEETPRMTWWSDRSIEIVRIDGELYALYGWNGEKWLHCWKCIDCFTADPDDDGKEYTITPVYDWSKWNEDDGEFQDADGNAIDGIIGYEVA